MDEKDWRFLKVLYEEKNITKAAEKLFVSQPALSYRLKQLEEEFDMKLFFKRKRGIEFTSEGEYLAKYANDMLKQLQQTKDGMLNMQKKVKGTIRLGVSSNFAQYKLPEILREFSKQYPDVQFMVNTGWSTKVMDLLGTSSVHLGILRGDYDWNGERFLLDKERLCIISKSEIQLKDLPKLPLIDYHTDSSLKRLINRWWQETFAMPPLVTMETDRQDTSKEMVKHGLGYAIVPEICLRPSDELFVKGLSYKDGQPVLRDTWLMYQPDSLHLSVVKAFIEFLRSRQG